MSNPILQFGTSRFLQAHVDFFVAVAARRDPALALGKITVVQTTASSDSRARIDALRSAGRYPVRIRGRRRDETVDTTVECDSITEALHTSEDWPLLIERVKRDVKVIVSNTADAGYALFDEDTADLLDGQRTPRGFAAKLAVLLHARFQAGAEPITLLPCELVSRNGDTLRDLVVGVARGWNAGDAFIGYLTKDCVWVNSLVDRIVSEPIQPVGAIAEPYALWAIERQAGMLLPCEHEDIVVTDDLAHYERLKLLLLNLGHTMLAQIWRSRDGSPDMTVLDAMRDPAYRDPLEATWRDEVLPVFAALGKRDVATEYLASVRDRFENPFLVHRLADIARNHDEKKIRRFQPVIDLARELKLDIEQTRLRDALESA
ncbi:MULTISPECIES: D-mannonate oxidoreductase [Caballeronia]|uniref:mannitol dehydrogenase family protein n=1 Tax=Caballeronia TaxID=1827195 RepID=UPI00045F05D0|nr:MULTISPECIES: D-mannonate oxidoreductase [unclassified Caballeronia]MCE4543665.1 mannitol dehydrogenase family protein [Caballeronia sp. PC1]MCE4567278.1 mannitol dehydrogenase family protein [Caballeronia sp. CLC5]BAO87482.1 mannitol dehydrogenase domain protein [Burkholderia sp. RPE67]